MTGYSIILIELSFAIFISVLSRLVKYSLFRHDRTRQPNKRTVCINSGRCCTYQAELLPFVSEEQFNCCACIKYTNHRCLSFRIRSTGSTISWLFETTGSFIILLSKAARRILGLSSISRPFASGTIACW